MIVENYGRVRESRCSKIYMDYVDIGRSFKLLEWDFWVFGWF